MSRSDSPKRRRHGKSIDDERRDTCQVARKEIHRSRKSALTWANKNKRVSGIPLYVYKCHSCRKWHLTKRPT